MAESKIKDINSYQIHGWMLNRLELKGAALQVYAIIFSFSQDGESQFYGSLQYLMDFTNAGRNTIIRALKDLVERGYIHKTENIINGVQFNTYKANLQMVNAICTTGAKMALGECQNGTGGSAKMGPPPGAKMAPNNKGLNNKSSDNKGDKKETPTADYSETTFSEAMKAKVNQWLQYKSERKEDYQPTGLQSLITQIQNNVNKHGEDAVIDLIGDCMANGYRGIIWDRLKPKQGTTGRKEPVPNWMKDKDRQQAFDDRLKKDMDWLKQFDQQQKTAGNDPELAARAEALRQQFQGANTP